jgi:toxin CcdB
MARYDVYASPGGIGFVLDVQTDLLDGLMTRVVVPLLPVASAPTPAKLLNPVVDIGGEAHVMITQFISAVPVRALGKPTGELAARADEITRALDMLFHGF